MKSKHAKAWQEEVYDKLDTVNNNRTWIAVKKPASARQLHSKWVFKIKLDAEGSVERFNAHLVACRNEQVMESTITTP
jgi:hypothetical protein